MKSNFEFGEELKKRTKDFALRNIKLFQSLPKTEEAKIMGRHLLRSSTSVAVNYRAACRARSDAEFYAKICIAIEEADESLFWIELLEDANILSGEKLINLKMEANELTSILIKIRTSLNKKKLNNFQTPKLLNS